MASTGDQSQDPILDALQERAKELSCLYHVDEVLDHTDLPPGEVYQRLVDVLPSGWRYPSITRARLTIEGETYAAEGLTETPWVMRADITIEGERAGELAVYYLEKRPEADEGPFLGEERRLIDAIARRVSVYAMHQRLRRAGRRLEQAAGAVEGDDRRPSGVLKFLRQTDPQLLTRITAKMINHMCWNGIVEARELLRESRENTEAQDVTAFGDNLPLPRRALGDLEGIADRTFEMANRYFAEDQILGQIRSWINEERAGVLNGVLEKPSTTVTEIADALRDYRRANVDESALPKSVRASLRTSLLRRLLTDRLDFLKTARDFIDVNDCHELVERMIYSPRSQGKVGGKASGLIVASQVLRKSDEYADLLRDVKVPRTWYVASDGLTEFVHYNMLDDLIDRKYQEIERIRQDYPHIVQVFKNSPFPPDLVKGLSSVLDELSDRPLVVRSSSLLEDQIGASFSGKYKSLFLANQGTKHERLEALQDAVAEIYASVFGPDPIEYRSERGLLDFREEMGVLIQEVVGTRVGKYYLPAYAGVAFSRNELRWSPRIQREDGLIRLVPGLGTRAVDRLADDYPMLIAPAQPQLQVNTTPDEIIRYSPQKVDVINLEGGGFETVEIDGLLRESGEEYPKVRDMISIVEGDRVRRPSGLEPDWERDDFVVTFDGLVARTPFVRRVRALLKLLEEKLDMPVDFEFASDGESLYLLQCRAQSLAEEAPAPIPRDLPPERVVFSAHRFVSNGRVPEITHVVYVDPDRYAELDSIERLKDVGRAVGRLNKLLPKRQFILMGPGRWGSRGDIKLGVSVTYSDINNTAMLIEIARQKGKYVPQLSFGTHFFQDLVESGIRYLPLYPDEPGNVFNERFLARSESILSDLVPDLAHVGDTVRVIDVAARAGGQVLRVLMNAELDEAVAVLTAPGELEDGGEASSSARVTAQPSSHWRWRMRMAKRIAAALDAERFDVRALYVFGSTKNATAGPASDIDLLVHVGDDEAKRGELTLWLEGWSRALAEMNFLRTGYPADGLLDVHVITDEDIANRTSYAVKIGAVTDAARPLPLATEEQG